jgi:predicted transcriptional regulator
MSPNVLLLSIHEKYATQIFEGRKTVELRRLKPRLSSGDLIVVYVTSPRKEILGVLEVSKVMSSSPDSLWEVVKGKSGVTANEFNSYFENAPVGFAIFVKKYAIFLEPLKLDVLREKWSDFRPPQGYKYLDEQEINIIESITNYDILGFSGAKKIIQNELCFAAN